jgi:hypothetical protein
MLGSLCITRTAAPADDFVSLTERPASSRRASPHKLGGPASLPNLTSIFSMLTNDDTTSEKFRLWAMKIPKHLDKISTGFGLVVLAVGFASLGFLSFINRHPEDAANGLFFEATYSIVGSLISILVGATFFAVAVLSARTLGRRKRSVGPETAAANAAPAASSAG